MRVDSTETSDFIDFVTVQSGPLLRVAAALTGTASGAEDLLQDTLARLYPKWGSVSAADAPAAYVRRAMINRHISLSRRRRDLSAEVELYAHTTAIRDLADDVAVRHTLERLLQKLPAKQRAALILKYYLDMNNAEVAKEMGVRPGTAASLVSRALVTLRQKAIFDTTNYNTPTHAEGFEAS